MRTSDFSIFLLSLSSALVLLVSLPAFAATIEATVTIGLCGDGVINSTEQCDGIELGGATCVSRGFSGGTLTCYPACEFNTSACNPLPPARGGGGSLPGISNAIENDAVIRDSEAGIFTPIMLSLVNAFNVFMGVSPPAPEAGGSSRKSSGTSKTSNRAKGKGGTAESRNSNAQATPRRSLMSQMFSPRTQTSRPPIPMQGTTKQVRESVNKLNDTLNTVIHAIEAPFGMMGTLLKRNRNAQLPSAAVSLGSSLSVNATVLRTALRRIVGLLPLVPF